jgi:hypothetical protein
MQRHLPLVCTLLAAVALPPAAARAQLLPRDSWMIATFPSIIQPPGPGGLYFMSADYQSFVRLTNQSTNLAQANCVEVDPTNGFVYVGTTNATPGGGQIYSVLVAGTNVIRETLLTTVSPDGGYISGIALRGDDVWYVTSGSGGTRGAIGYVPKTGGAPVNVFTMTMPGVNGLGNAIATNGREIFVGTSTAAADMFNVWVLDPEEATPQLRGLAKIPIVSGSASPSPGQLFMAEGEQLFVSDFSGFMHKLDTVTGSWTTLNAASRAPQSSGNGGLLNPWTDTAVLVAGAGSTPRQTQVWDNAQAQWSTPGNATFVGVGAGVGAMFVRPFVHFGKGCAGPSGREPRVGASGLSKVGSQSFRVGLRDGFPSRPAFLMFGVSNTRGFGVPLPLDLAPFGAPGCRLLTSSDVLIVATAGAQGDASVPVPIPNDPSLAGVSLYVQWAQPGAANALGLAFSDGAALHVR